MSDSDTMRAGFEAWAKAELFDPRFPNANYLERDETSYFHTVVDNYWTAWQAAYKAGRMAKQREAEEWSKAVNKRWIEKANEREGQL